MAQRGCPTGRSTRRFFCGGSSTFALLRGPASSAARRGDTAVQQETRFGSSSSAAAPQPVGGSLSRARSLGAVAGRRVAARDPFLLRRPTSRGHSLPDGRPGCRVLMWLNERPRNWPGIVYREKMCIPWYPPCIVKTTFLWKSPK